jgi:DNA-binding SARP family transcriptional activator
LTETAIGTRFYLLGPLEVVTSAGPIPIKAKRLRALLAILLLHTGQVVSIDRIVDGIWPDEPPRSVVENIRTYVSQLRSLLHRGADRGRLESHPGGYRLLADPEELDLLRFTSLAADGRHALRLGDCSTAAVLLGEAIRLWRGDPLPELDLGPAMRAKTIALEEQRWRVQTDWISARLALGEHAELVATLRELIGERPLDEGLWRCLVTALYAMGRTGEALAACAAAHRTFVDELGIEPGPELRAAQAAILRGDEVPVPRFGSATVLQGVPPPHQVPAAGPALVGRGEELRRLQTLVEDAGPGPARLRSVLVSGPPGVGKSATAVAAATAVRAAFPDGQLYLDLRGSTAEPVGAADAVTTLLGGFGVRPEAIPDGLDRRRSLYQSLLGSRRMLVLLDDAGDARQVAPLVPGAGRNLLIVTSRRRLADLEVDVRLDLEPLSGAEAVSMLGGIVGPERVDEEFTASMAILEACGRLPAAIRIAGARLAARPRHPLRVLADRLRAQDRVLDELSLNGLSMRRLFETSYRDLDPALQRCFRALGACSPTHVTAAALGELLQLPAHAADRQLEGLVHEGLLSPGPTRDGVPTYWMPTVLHTYARERLTTEGPEPLVPENGVHATGRVYERLRAPGAVSATRRQRVTNDRRPSAATADR